MNYTKKMFLSLHIFTNAFVCLFYINESDPFKSCTKSFVADCIRTTTTIYMHLSFSLFQPARVILRRLRTRTHTLENAKQKSLDVADV